MRPEKREWDLVHGAAILTKYWNSQKLVRYENNQKSLTQIFLLFFPQGKKEAKYCLWEVPDVRLNRQRFQNSHYKNIQRTKGNHAWRSTGKYDDNVWSNREYQLTDWNYKI